ncbi:MlaA family lipoprotein [Amphibiibacter pelophylacis]|uniref:VacJ family lipoprotein n=1 Tax=Amphibiibacter pelophylacis TaxID=1799477 RepID=A0ACC6P4U9_9BURK
MTRTATQRPAGLKLSAIALLIALTATAVATMAPSPAWAQNAAAAAAKSAAASTAQSEEDRLNAAALEGEQDAAADAKNAVSDPLEGYNRAMFGINDAIDGAVVAPVARAYQQVTPTPIQKGVGNFFGNLRDVWSTVNLALQGRGRDGLAMLMRVATNTTLGFGGLIDVGSAVGLTRVPSDLGLTLGHWGVPSGPYVVLPLLGPSTVRDTAGTASGMAATSSSYYLDTPAQQYFATGLNLVDQRARLLSVTDAVNVAALDKYSFVRNAYLAQRNDSVQRTFDPASGPTAAENAPDAQP